MPIVRGGVDTKSDAPVRTFFAKNANTLQLQLEAEPPVYDRFNRMLKAAVNTVARFKDGLYKTNRKEEIEHIENSIAFKDGLIVDYDVLTRDAREKKAAELLDLIAGDSKLSDIVTKRLGVKKPKAE